MAIELKATIINMKTLTQDIDDPIVVGSGDANGSVLRIIFTQEAAAQFTENTKVYLSWLHREQNIKGYNVFTQIKKQNDENFPPTWEIHYPRSMLYEGNVLACIQIVDEVSIATSKNFVIHILVNPNDGSDFIKTNDFTEFQQAVIELATLKDQIETQSAQQKNKFENMQLVFEEMQNNFSNIQDLAEEAKQISENSLERINEALEEINNLSQELLDYTISPDELANFVTQNQIEDFVTASDVQNEHQALWNAMQITEWGFEEEG